MWFGPILGTVGSFFLTRTVSVETHRSRNRARLCTRSRRTRWCQRLSREHICPDTRSTSRTLRSTVTPHTGHPHTPRLWRCQSACSRPGSRWSCSRAWLTVRSLLQWPCTTKQRIRARCNSVRMVWVTRPVHGQGCQFDHKLHTIYIYRDNIMISKNKHFVQQSVV